MYIKCAYKHHPNKHYTLWTYIWASLYMSTPSSRIYLLGCMKREKNATAKIYICSRMCSVQKNVPTLWDNFKEFPFKNAFISSSSRLMSLVIKLQSNYFAVHHTSIFVAFIHLHTLLEIRELIGFISDEEFVH